MPKLGMEPIRKKALLDAAIVEIGAAGSLNVSVAKIAHRAGMSAALAHHYFGSKDEIYLATMRKILRDYAREISLALKNVSQPRERIDIIVKTSLSGKQFNRDIVSAWLSFYVLAQNSQPARRLLRVYTKRLMSNLVYDLRRLGFKSDAISIAHGVSAAIDGFYIRAALGEAGLDSQTMLRLISDNLDLTLSKLVK